jgi:hypothetical protein
MKSHRPRSRRIAALALAGAPVARASQLRDAPVDDPGASRTPRVRRPVTIGVVASGADRKETHEHY